MNIRHIVLTTDLSPDSIELCKPIARLARESGARITLLHVVEVLEVAPHGSPLAPPARPADTTEKIEEARAAVEKLKPLVGEGLTIDADVIPAGDIAEAVAEYADEHDADLIAVSTHGRTGFRRLALGSVAEAIVRHAGVPVLCFPKEKH